MEKNARRKIVSEKSQYVRKPSKWNLCDEIQFKWLMLMAKKKSRIHCYGLRSRVRSMLEKYGYKVSYIPGDCYRIEKEK